MSEDNSVDVLVVGAGPTGLTMACELLRHGATVRLVDQLAAPVIYSKAAVVHARTMEHFDAMGVAPSLLERARIIHGMNMFAGGKRVAHVGFDEGVDSPYPHAYGLSQADTETALTAHLERLGGAIERSTSLSSFSEDDAGVRATLTRGGERVEARARFVVGCDGAHSVVRKALGLTFEGGPYEERLIQSDLRVDFGGLAPDDEILVFLHERGPVMAFPLFTDGRYRLILLEAEGAPSATEPSGAPPEPTLDDFRRGLEERQIRAELSDPAWTIGFRIHHRHADKLRVGRAFIAGDAAHIHSPVGGQGMNTGIQDAVNLAWKLALAVKHRAKPVLLDSYEAERLPIIRALVSATDRATRAMTTAVHLRNPIAVGLRDQLISSITHLGAVQEKARSALTMLSIAYKSSPICGEERSSLWHAKVGSNPDGEAPGVFDWAAFGGGPAPGARALDAAGRLGTEVAHVQELLRAGRHVALLFDGAAATEPGYANLISVARRIKSRAGDLCEPLLVIPMAAPPAAAAWEGRTLLDPDGDIHQRYGARSECLYVIRPDGYVGFRGQPAEGTAVEAWLDRWLLPC